LKGSDKIDLRHKEELNLGSPQNTKPSAGIADRSSEECPEK
jgi:hypothetical protein